MSNKKAIRDAFFTEHVQREIVKLTDGTEIEVRDSTLGQLLDSISMEDRRKQMVSLLINCCYVPGTDEKVFEPADFDAIMELPANGKYQELMEAINKRASLQQRKDAEGND